MSRLTIVEGNSNNKDNVRAIMVKGEKGEQGDLNNSHIVDNLTTDDNTKVLSAKQGKVLNDMAKKKPYYFDTIAEMKLYELKAGEYAITKGYYSANDGGAGEYAIVDDDTLTDDGGSIIELFNGLKALLIIKENINPEQFGVYGDGIHDDSDALQNYINCSKIGNNIYLSRKKAVYRITKQIDLKEKGIVGNGFSAQEQQYYNMNSILVDNGNYSNDDLTLNNIALINVGRDIRNLQLVASTELDDNISGMLVHGYNTNINNINIRGFYDQIIVPLITVSFRVNNLTSIGNKHSGVHILDTNNVQSTTAYFDKCSWQWGEYSILFDKQVYGSSFSNIVSEHMKYGFKAQCFIGCVFSNIWFESSSSEEENPAWITTTVSQQLTNNIYQGLYIRTPWFNPANTTDIAKSNNAGGVSVNSSKIATMDSVGRKTVFDTDGIHTAFSNYLLTNRRLKITTQDTAEGSNYKTPLVIAAPNSELYFANLNDDDNTPVTKKILIGEDANSKAYYGKDIYTKEKKLWSTHDNETNTNGYFYSPMLVTYISHRVTNPQNNGWEIVENNDDTFTLQQINGSTKTLKDPHILISGIVAGSIAGQDTPLIPCITNITSAYSGSYSSYGILKSFKITFKDLSNTTVKPYRFTIALTSEKE